MLICEVNNMRHFDFWAIMASFRKNNILSLNPIFTILEKKVSFDYIVYYNIVTIRIDIF
jgi:hypothetical protein